MVPTIPELAKRASEPDGLVVAGCLSGTSMDGIDVAFARGWLRANEPRVELIRAVSVPFEPLLQARLEQAAAGNPMTAAEYARLDLDLGRALGAAIATAAQDAQVRLDLVASHGQTVGHHDGAGDPGAPPWTLQLGDPDAIAEFSRCAVAYDFRRADVAGGGEGAPLVPFVDGALFHAAPRPVALLNLGGIANLTWLGEDSDSLGGFDVGPANAWLDGFSRRLLNRSFDADGAVAARGRIQPDLLGQWLEQPFFSRRPPKSTGRDTFSSSWVEARLEEGQGRAAEDLLATAAAAVAQSVAEACRRFLPARPLELIVAGGGWHHQMLQRELKASTGLPVEPSDRYGVPVDARESLAFALLGLLAVGEVPLEVAQVTGGGGPRVLGRLIPARPLGADPA